MTSVSSSALYTEMNKIKSKAWQLLRPIISHSLPPLTFNNTISFTLNLTIIILLYLNYTVELRLADTPEKQTSTTNECVYFAWSVSPCTCTTSYKSKLLKCGHLSIQQCKVTTWSGPNHITPPPPPPHMNWTT